MILTDEYTPRTVGDTANPLKMQLLDYSEEPYNISALSSSDFSIQMYEPSSQITINGSGTFTTIDGPNGIVLYTWDLADVSTVGTFNISVKAMFAGKPLHLRPAKPLEILPEKY